MSKSLPVLALFLTLMGGVFIVIGLATPNWITRNSGQFHQGLWKYCANNNPCLKLERGPDFAGWLQAVRVLDILGFLNLLVGLILLVNYVRQDEGPQSLYRIRNIIAFCVVSFCFTMSGILLYAAKKNQGFFGGRYDPNEYDFGWSFSLTAVGGVLMFGNAVILAIQLRKNTKLGTYESI
ncbi:uncharacterized protein LOC128205512 [Mya arenaria]|uniref:uncharacterized protein LOC128205512 n=1 Tax=Mya arenaria TaxID=6604 RepID=UPI0022E12613|nr:uncharacterized protein LOC128205512 [Mya arenaria]